MRNLESGLDKIDRALAQLKPHHKEERVGNQSIHERVLRVAYNTFNRVPDFSNRSQQAQELALQLQPYGGAQ